jgi:hypothetical protein
VGREGRPFVAAPWLNLNHYSRQIKSVGLHCRDLIPVHVPVQQYWTKWCPFGRMSNLLLKLVLFNLQEPAQLIKGLLKITDICSNDGQFKCRAVVNKNKAMTIIDNAPGWRDILKANPIVF